MQMASGGSGIAISKFFRRGRGYPHFTPTHIVCTYGASTECEVSQGVSEKQRTNVTLNAANLAAAREFGLNVSAISDEALARAVRQARAAAWLEENAMAIAERRSWIEANGAPLADIQVLKID
jgi:antitoxin CcdA